MLLSLHGKGEIKLSDNSGPVFSVIKRFEFFSTSVSIELFVFEVI
jgi:hypothetical protein